MVDGRGDGQSADYVKGRDTRVLMQIVILMSYTAVFCSRCGKFLNHLRSGLFAYCGDCQCSTQAIKPRKKTGELPAGRPH